MRRAFVMGSNGPSDARLQYAVSDAQKVSNCLSLPRYAYNVTQPLPGSNALAVRGNMFDAVEECSHDDYFLCYFSGHGIIDSGNLFLLWDDTRRANLLTSSIPMSDVLNAMRMCRAKNKVLILDCCHAGAFVKGMGWKDQNQDTSLEDVGVRAENYMVLMASGQLEKARELDSLQGGFFTHALCTNLTEKAVYNITLPAMREWIEDEARAYNRYCQPENTVPMPRLFGESTGEFFLNLPHPTPEQLYLESIKKAWTLSLSSEEINKLVTKFRKQASGLDHLSFVKKIFRNIDAEEWEVFAAAIVMFKRPARDLLAPAVSYLDHLCKNQDADTTRIGKIRPKVLYHLLMGIQAVCRIAKEDSSLSITQSDIDAMTETLNQLAMHPKVVSDELAASLHGHHGLVHRIKLVQNTLTPHKSRANGE